MQRWPTIAVVMALSGLLSAAQAEAGSAPVKVSVADPSVELNVTDLKRTDDGATLTLHALASNASGASVELGHVSEMYLIDFRNRRKYMVITDSSLACLCAPDGAATVPASGQLKLWAKFPAPPEGVSAMSFGWGGAEPVAVQIER